MEEEQKTNSPKPKGVESLAAAVAADVDRERGFRVCADADAHRCEEALAAYEPCGALSCGKPCEACGRLVWAVERAGKTAALFGLDWRDVLAKWESGRRGWYMNYYQDANQPDPEGFSGEMRAFRTVAELHDAVGDAGFICPSCGKTSMSPYVCPECGWNSGGFFGTCGRGCWVFVADEARWEEIFMPEAFKRDPSLGALPDPSGFWRRPWPDGKR